ncbi:hypothetical protein G5B40_02790 [Pikeienuella piscinae]|uniref:Uncharacterized protein n=1 Tax=Pikeienuella piscinae TaxID=2748098 RepID=A0A7L5BSV7_9RHOB|nr:hypothetical protein [Pikeienuella piscinae]QIE54455.1 hypothetical protein G5B40_02790 [Pikeienuella piscinae]
MEAARSRRIRRPPRCRRHGLGSAEGAALARRPGGWQVISWALIMALPIMGGLARATSPGV